jgi:hypothetical protein
MSKQLPHLSTLQRMEESKTSNWEKWSESRALSDISLDI